MKVKDLEPYLSGKFVLVEIGGQKIFDSLESAFYEYRVLKFRDVFTIEPSSDGGSKFTLVTVDKERSV